MICDDDVSISQYHSGCHFSVISKAREHKFTASNRLIEEELGQLLQYFNHQNHYLEALGRRVESGDIQVIQLCGY